MNNAFQHQVVRDLVWAIASPPLIVPGKKQCCWYSEQWYRELYRQSENWLCDLDAQPEYLQQRVDSQKDRRMGRYFETLWAFWLEQHPRYEIVQQNLPLRQGGNTIGELDFLVLDKQSGKYLHWEMAVKFYLGVGDTRMQCNWHGPGKKDRLDKKVEHLHNRQSVISRQPAASVLLDEMGLHVDECGVILKGRLFYPSVTSEPILSPVDAGQEHEKGKWLTLDEFAGSYTDNEHFFPLLGEGWMAQPGHPGLSKYLSKNNILESIERSRYRLPLYLGQHPNNDNSERIFLVSNDWSESL